MTDEVSEFSISFDPVPANDRLDRLFIKIILNTDGFELQSSSYDLYKVN